MYDSIALDVQSALKTFGGNGAIHLPWKRANANGNGKTVNQPTYNALQANGVKVKWAWPGVLWHQKSIVRDGSAVAVMTCNLYAPYYPILRDYAVITDNAARVRRRGHFQQ